MSVRVKAVTNSERTVARNGVGAAGASLKPSAPKEIYLHAGQTAVSNEPTCISMILGSCVSVCLFDSSHAIGGATHYMLPKWDGNGQPSPRYGDVAINTLIEEFRTLGSKTSDLRAMVFGGARMFQTFRKDGQHIGTRNASIAIELLARYAISIVTKNIGGSRGRKLKMETDTGAISVTLIGNE